MEDENSAVVGIDDQRTRRTPGRTEAGRTVCACPPLQHRDEVHQQRLTGERALFGGKHLHIRECVFADGESPLKHSRDIEITDSLFEWKYPLWYATDVTIDHSVLATTARADIWYSDGVTITNSTIDAPKSFRRTRRVRLDHVDLPRADETMWNCENVTLDNVSVRGEYFAMNSRNITADGLRVTGGYAFDGTRDVDISNATILSKDAFWNSENVTVRDSFIVGEYLGWNARNLTFINCTIQSLQGLCYIDNLVLSDCRLIDTTLPFEYSTVDAAVTTRIDSVINPAGGTIRCAGIGELILDPSRVDPGRTTIVTPGAPSAV